jgi:hypothetical protein
MARSTCSTISSVVSTLGDASLDSPGKSQLVAHLLAWGEPRRTVSPVVVNAINALASIRSAMSRAAKEIPPGCGGVGQRRSGDRLVGPLRVEVPLDQVRRQTAADLPGRVVTTGLPRRTPRNARARISRSTVHRATGRPARTAR